MELVPAVGVCLWGQVGTTPLRVGCGVPKGWHKAERGTAADGTTSCPHPSFVKPTPWGHSLASLPAPLAGLVAVGRILEAHTWENPSVGRTRGMGQTHPCSACTSGPRRLQEERGQCWHGTAQHSMALHGTVWHSLAWHGMAHHGTARHSTLWASSGRLSPAGGINRALLSQPIKGKGEEQRPEQNTLERR